MGKDPDTYDSARRRFTLGYSLHVTSSSNEASTMWWYASVLMVTSRGKLSHLSGRS